MNSETPMSRRQKVVAACVAATGFFAALSHELAPLHSLWAVIASAVSGAIAAGTGGLAAYLTKPNSPPVP